MTQLFPRLIRADDRSVGSRDGDEPSTVDGGTGDRSNASRARSECVERETRIAAGRRQRQERQGEESDKDDESKKKWTKSERRDLVKRAQVWAPTNIPSMDMRLGPERPDAFQPGQEVTCDYVHDEDLPGTSRKFNCAITKDDVVKVRYGEENGKVEGEVLATRLLWALGFGADAVYPVKVRCRGCSADPWVNRDPEAGERVFEPAAIERKFPGEEIKADKDGGWSWKELRHVDEQLGGAPLARDRRDEAPGGIHPAHRQQDHQRAVRLFAWWTLGGRRVQSSVSVHARRRSDLRACESVRRQQGRQRQLRGLGEHADVAGGSEDVRGPHAPLRDRDARRPANQ